MVTRHDTDQGLRWQVPNSEVLYHRENVGFDVYGGGWGAGTQQAYCTPGVGGNSQGIGRGVQIMNSLNFFWLQ
jgi:hypothetical protein